MKNIAYIVLLFGLMLNPLKASSQTNKEYYLKNAYNFFEKGDYNNAQKALNIYFTGFVVDESDSTYQDASELKNKIQQCKDFVDKAENAIARQQIKDAIDYYRGVLSINPNDPIAKKKIADLGMTVKNDKPQVSLPKRVKTNPIKPISSGFEMRISSSFDSKGPFGFGFHFNKSYFKFGLDVLLGFASELAEYDMLFSWSSSWESHQTTIKYDFFFLRSVDVTLNGCKATESEYVYPRAQLTINPGINLRYFSIECGLGVFLCENLIMTHFLASYDYGEYYEGVKSIKPYFIARPTIVGYIPVSKNHDCLSVSLGYNFVSGAEPLNGLVVGLGFSWNFSI